MLKSLAIPNTYFSWTKFKGTVDFSYASFSKNSDEKKKDTFYESYFYDKVYFGNINIQNEIIFNNLRLEEKGYLLFKNINYIQNSKIEIINTVIKGRIEFNDVSINEIDFNGSDVMGGGVVNRINFEAKPANWQTASFLKHEAIVRDNTIEALEYKAIEKEKYTIFLLDKEDKNIREWGECFSLLISKLSNNHGQSWIKGVIFVLISWFIFFVPFYELIMFSDIIFKQSNFLSMETFLSSISVYYNPTNYGILIKYLETNYNSPWSIILKIPAILIYTLGKISIGYGIVEIVQAFRKFNTKGN